VCCCFQAPCCTVYCCLCYNYYGTETAAAAAEAVLNRRFHMRCAARCVARRLLAIAKHGELRTQIHRAKCVLPWRPFQSEPSAIHPFHGRRNFRILTGQCSGLPGARQSEVFVSTCTSFHSTQLPKPWWDRVYKVWGMLKRRVYRTRINSVDHLKQCRSGVFVEVACLTACMCSLPHVGSGA